MARLNKFDAEALMNGYDADAIGALSTALAKVLDKPASVWAELIAACSFDEDRRSSLIAQDQRALDELAAELNELRTLR